MLFLTSRPIAASLLSRLLILVLSSDASSSDDSRYKFAMASSGFRKWSNVRELVAGDTHMPWCRAAEVSLPLLAFAARLLVKAAVRALLFCALRDALTLIVDPATALH